MEDLREEDWVSLKVYAGAHPGAMDYFITMVIPEVLSQGGFDRWFFLRFLDDQGLHVRFRLRAHAGERARLQRVAMLTCNRGLDGLGALSGDGYRPLVLPQGDPDSAWREQTPVAVRSAQYEPELEKYGGEPGMTIAEAVFETSSRIAVSILRADLAGELSRKTLAPCLMAIAAEVFLPRNPGPFWTDYAGHWLGGDTAFARDWRERFLAQASLLRERKTEVVARQVEFPEANAWLADWAQALHTAYRQYRRLRIFREFPSPRLGFHFIHTMNNRLGLSTLEEAYLATLLEQRAGGAAST